METITLQDGTVCNLTLKFSLQLKLQQSCPFDYKKYSTAVTRASAKDADAIFMNLRIIYAAYLCGLIEQDKLSERLTFEQFIDAIPQSIAMTGTIAGRLINPKLTGDSGKRFNPQ